MTTPKPDSAPGGGVPRRGGRLRGCRIYPTPLAQLPGWVGCSGLRAIERERERETERDRERETNREREPEATCVRFGPRSVSDRVSG